MPPSGYTTEQAESLKSFLKLCAKALEKEKLEKKESYIEALTRECEDIRQTNLNKKNENNIPFLVLSLTHTFYCKLLNLKPATSTSFWDAVDSSLVEIENDILNIAVKKNVGIS